MMEIKGSALVATMNFVRDKFGDKGFDKWVDSLSFDAQRLYTGNLLSGEWYPLTKMGTEPRKKVCELFYNNDPRGAINIGRYSAEYGLKGIYRFWIQFINMQFLAKKVSKAMSTYYRPVDSNVNIIDKKSLVIHINKFPEPSKVMEYNHIGYIEKALELCGYKEVNVKLTKSLADKEDYTEIFVSAK